jgi:hypothetical protein
MMENLGYLITIEKWRSTLSLGRRIFIFEEDGTIRRIPIEKYEAFLFEGERFPEYANAKIRFAEILLELRNSEPTGQISRITFFSAFCGNDGSLDTDKDWEGRLLLANAMAIHYGYYPSNVMTKLPKCTDEQSKQEFLWNPTGEQKARLSELLWSAN